MEPEWPVVFQTGRMLSTSETRPATPETGLELQVLPFVATATKGVVSARERRCVRGA